MSNEMRIVYSFRIWKELGRQKIYPIQIMPHPTIEGFNCWVYKNDLEFQTAFDRILEDKGDAQSG